MSISLVNKKNMREWEPKVNSALEQITSTTKGSKWVFDCDYVDFEKALKEIVAADPAYASSAEAMGELAYKKIEFFPNFIEEIYRDELMAEAFNEKAAAHKIKFVIARGADVQTNTAFKDGVVVLTMHTSRLCYGYNDITRFENGGNAPGCDLWYNLERA